MSNFIRAIVEEDVRSGKHKEIVTRFPPEPNGFLHLGHAKSICLNFGLARDFNGRCHLRFDDTNPTREDMRYIESIQEDVKWLGGDWGEHLYYASSYFPQLYEYAIRLIKKGLAYVDHQTELEVRQNRGDLFTPGADSRYRNRTIEENLELFEKMRNGEFKEGECVLRAKIDMKHSNMHMRDPLLYRIRFQPHPKTGSTWCIYPIYDFAHGQSDSIERITHSICTLEFEDHRPLYEWFQEALEIHRTRQIEFARLNVTRVVMSKRKLQALVEEKFVKDWDDPRLPTVAGMRRRGYPPEALRDLCERVGVAKRPAMVPFELIENCVREALHPIAWRRSVVLNPIKVVITNYEGEGEWLDGVPNHPENSALGSRKIRFSSTLYIDRNDFRKERMSKFFRLFPGNEVRLRYGYWIKCEKFTCNDKGDTDTVYCTYDPATKGGEAPSGRKVKATIHWVSADDCCDVECRIYDHLFSTETPDDVPEGKTWKDFINPKSLEIRIGKGENSIKEVSLHPYKDSSNGKYLQFERVGFFVADYDSTVEHPVFNMTVPLVDTFAAESNSQSKEAQAKEAAKAAREKAAAERAAKKAAREAKAEAKAKAEAEAKAKAEAHSSWSPHVIINLGEANGSERLLESNKVEDSSRDCSVAILSRTTLPK